MSLLILAAYTLTFALLLAGYFYAERPHIDALVASALDDDRAAPNPAHVANEAAYGAMNKEQLR